MNHEFHPAAESEFLESVEFYESRVPGLGEAFIAEVEAVVELLCRAPRQRPVEWPQDIRRGPLQRFPFYLVYREPESDLQLPAVAHARRKPNYWAGRL